MSKYCVTLGHCKKHDKNILRTQFKSVVLSHCFIAYMHYILTIFLNENIIYNIFLCPGFADCTNPTRIPHRSMLMA